MWFVFLEQHKSLSKGRPKMGACLCTAPNDATATRTGSGGKRGLLQRKISTFEKKRLYRIETFQADTNLSTEEKEQLVWIERNRTHSNALSPYPEDDLTYYREITFHVPDDDADAAEDAAGARGNHKETNAHSVSAASQSLSDGSWIATTTDTTDDGGGAQTRRRKKVVDFFLPADGSGDSTAVVAAAPEEREAGTIVICQGET
jgi:hypothetical protein